MPLQSSLIFSILQSIARCILSYSRTTTGQTCNHSCNSVTFCAMPEAEQHWIMQYPNSVGLKRQPWMVLTGPILHASSDNCFAANQLCIGYSINRNISSIIVIKFRFTAARCFVYCRKNEPNWLFFRCRGAGNVCGRQNAHIITLTRLCDYEWSRGGRAFN